MTGPSDRKPGWRSLDLTLHADTSRTMLRPFELATEEDRSGLESGRLHRLLQQVQSLDARRVSDELALVHERLDGRHRDVDEILYRNAVAARQVLPPIADLPHDRARLLGAFLTQEYAFEAAALFNPSVMPHPEQDEVPDGAVRLVLSLRCIGEGHVSSVAFRSLVWHGDERLELEPFSNTAIPPEIEVLPGGAARLTCEKSADVSESVLFPVVPSQSRGLEDLRLVRLTEDDGTHRFLGTYTAVGEDGINLQLMEGHGFRQFALWPVTGELAHSKGGALFPRRVGGAYRMVSRHGGQSLWLASSDDLREWRVDDHVMRGVQPWEWAQIGNCGSPIEIEEGWLLLTHGVGSVRNYSIGACLLDRDDPSIVLGRTSVPLISPEDVGRAGYVPNVVYSCGGHVMGGSLLLPYGVADSWTGFALLQLADILGALT